MPLCYLNRRSVNARDIGHSDFSSMSIFGINHTVFVGTVPLYIYMYQHESECLVAYSTAPHDRLWDAKNAATGQASCYFLLFNMVSLSRCTSGCSPKKACLRPMNLSCCKAQGRRQPQPQMPQVAVVMDGRMDVVFNWRSNNSCVNRLSKSMVISLYQLKGWNAWICLGYVWALKEYRRYPSMRSSFSGLKLWTTQTLGHFFGIFMPFLSQRSFRHTLLTRMYLTELQF